MSILKNPVDINLDPSSLFLYYSTSLVIDFSNKQSLFSFNLLMTGSAVHPNYVKVLYRSLVCEQTFYLNFYQAYKDLELPTDVTFVWKYLKNSYSQKAFTESCPADQVTLWFEARVELCSKGFQGTGSIFPID